MIGPIDLRRIEEAKSLLSKTIPVARRVFGACHETTLRMRLNYATALYNDDSATLDDLGVSFGKVYGTVRVSGRDEASLAISTRHPRPSRRLNRSLHGLRSSVLYC